MPDGGGDKCADRESLSSILWPTKLCQTPKDLGVLTMTEIWLPIDRACYALQSYPPARMPHCTARMWTPIVSTEDVDSNRVCRHGTLTPTVSTGTHAPTLRVHGLSTAVGPSHI